MDGKVLAVAPDEYCQQVNGMMSNGMMNNGMMSNGMNNGMVNNGMMNIYPPHSMDYLVDGGVGSANNASDGVCSSEGGDADEDELISKYFEVEKAELAINNSAN